MTVIKAGDPIYGGYVLSRAEGVIFIKGAVPGEVVEIALEEKKRDYSVASVIDIVEPSEARVEPECAYFGECGGCHLQFASYEKQVEMKEFVLLDCLRRIGKMEVELAPSVYAEPFGYRQRAQFKVSREGTVGFYREGTVSVVEIERCPLLTDGLNSSLASLRRIDLSGVRDLNVIAGDNTIVLVKGSGLTEDSADAFLSGGFTGVAFEDGSYKGTGAPYITLDLNGLRYTVSPWSFMQTNWGVNRLLSDTIMEELGTSEGLRVLDLYAGGGNFSLPLAVDAEETIAVEENRHSIADGKRNRSANRITGYNFVKGRAEDVKLSGSFDVLILDPPRAGLSKRAMERVLGLGCRTITYISCNPSTFARDLGALTEAYDVRSIRMVDMFPNTYHLEALAVLDRKQE